MPILLLVGGGLLLSDLVGGDKLLAPVELLDGGLAKLPDACTRTKVRRGAVGRWGPLVGRTVGSWHPSEQRSDGNGGGGSIASREQGPSSLRPSSSVRRWRQAGGAGGTHVVWRRRGEVGDGVVDAFGFLHRDGRGRGLAVVDAEALAVQRQVASVARDVVDRLLLVGVGIVEIPGHVLRRGHVVLAELGRVAHAAEADVIIVIRGGRGSISDASHIGSLLGGGLVPTSFAQKKSCIVFSASAHEGATIEQTNMNKARLTPPFPLGANRPTQSAILGIGARRFRHVILLCVRDAHNTDVLVEKCRLKAVAGVYSLYEPRPGCVDLSCS